MISKNTEAHIGKYNVKKLNRHIAFHLWHKRRKLGILP
jgi:hypothetical protein